MEESLPVYHEIISVCEVLLANITTSPAGIYLLKVKNRNTRTMCEICWKLTIKTPEQRHWRRSGVFIVNFEHVIAGWEIFYGVLHFTLIKKKVISVPTEIMYESLVERDKRSSPNFASWGIEVN